VNEHIDEDLPLILTGEADRATVYAAVDHLRDCTDCYQELLSLLIAHASLSSAARFAPEVISATAVPRHAAATVPPDLGAVFAQVRAEVDAEAHSENETRDESEISAGPKRRHTARWLTLAAAVVVAGAGAGVGIDQATSGSGSSTNVALSAYDVGSTPAKAVITAGTVKLDASKLPPPPSGALYEVWLTDTKGTTLHALGWVNRNGTGSYTAPAALLDHFAAIQVSVQQVSGPDGFSGTSVLRGMYA
jgi:hypothetical protein